MGVSCDNVSFVFSQKCDYLFQYVEMTDCDEFDSMIEICGRLDKLYFSYYILTFKVYRKPTNKNDYMHFYSHHNSKIKTGFIIGFYIRALRICCPQYLDEEFEYIKHSHKSLKYPKFFILNARKKALKIHLSNEPKENNPTIPITHRLISIPTNTYDKPLYNKLTK